MTHALLNHFMSLNDALPVFEFDSLALTVHFVPPASNWEEQPSAMWTFIPGLPTSVKLPTFAQNPSFVSDDSSVSNPPPAQVYSQQGVKDEEEDEDMQMATAAALPFLMTMQQHQTPVTPW